MKILLFAILLPFQLFAQDISGVWSGQMYNDTTRQWVRYELAISRDHGKFTAFSHTVFIIDGVENIGVKSLRIKRVSEGRYFLEDQKLLYNNYLQPPPRGVRVFSNLQLVDRDSVLCLSGNWTTNVTRVYKKVTGTLLLLKKKDLGKDSLISRLTALGLQSSLSFLPTQDLRDSSPQIASAPKPSSEPSPLFDSPVKEDTRTPALPSRPTQTENQPSERPVVLHREKKPSAKEQRDTNKKAIAHTTDRPTASSKSPGYAFGSPLPGKPREVAAAADMQNRKIETIRSVEIQSDSLELTLYDNGIVDGDTVSVLLNGKVIMPRVGLSLKPVKKTLYLTREMGDSLKLIMYAENLGSIPPNTGLLIVQDGQKVHYINFSGDLHQNAAIILRRKKY